MRPMSKKNPTKSRLIKIEKNGVTKTLPSAEVLASLKALSSTNMVMALAQAREIHEKNPQSEAIQSLYYQTLCDMELKQELLDATKIKLEKQPRDKVALSYLAHGLRLSGRVEEAKPLLEKLLKLSPGDPSALNSLGTAMKELGDFSAAKSYFDRAIKINPSYGKAYWNRSDIAELSSDQLSEIEAAISSARTLENEKHYLHFSAYRGYEKIGELDNAFEHLSKANAQKRKLLNYNVEEDLKIDQGIQTLFTEEFIRSRSSCGLDTFSPVFIFGMPRSGTTLVEQILASHSMVTGGNELSALGDATRSAQRSLRLQGGFPSWLSEMPDQGWLHIGNEYQRLVSELNIKTPHFTDKALLNYKAVGLIKVALPKAKLIQVDRNPMDLLFGCYRQLFNEGLRYSYDFEELAANYASYQRLMDHWDKLLPGFVVRINYEDLVENPKKEIEKLLNLCGLNSEAKCLEPHKTQRTVRTLSAAQVRQPIFTSGLNRWKKYERHLAPLKQALINQGISVES